MNYKVPLLSLFILTGCVYFNTFYNAEQSFDKAVKLIDEAADDDELPAVAKDLLKEAFANSEIVVKKYPESKYVDDAFFIMGKSSFFLDDFKNADRYLNRLIYEFPKSSYKEECEIWLTYTHYKMGDEDSALIKINNLLENPPRKKSLKYLLNKTAGEISLSRDSVQSAFLYFEEAAKLADNDSKRMSLYNKMVSISEQSHNYEQTIYLLEQLELYGTTSQIKQEARLKWIEYNRLLGNYNQVLLKIDELLEDPLFAIHHLSLKIEKAKIYLAQKDYSRANDYLKEILEDPSNARKDPTSEAAYLLGNLALTDGFDPELSIMYLDSVTQIIRNSTSRTKANNLKTKVTKYLSLIDELEFAENPIIEENDLIEEQPESPDTILYEIDEIPAFPDNEIEIEKPDIPSVMQVDSLLFTMAEMLLFEFNRPELSMEKYERLVSEFPDSKFAPQSLYVLYKFSEDDKDKWKTLLLDKYPNTDYAYEIEGALTSTEKPGNTLVDLRDLAWLELNDSPQKAADDFEKIAEEHGDPISAFNSAYIYEHYLYSTETAILKYQAFIDEYPDHELNSTATQRLDDIKTAVQVLKNKPVGWVDLFTDMIRIGSVADTLRASTSNNDILFWTNNDSAIIASYDDTISVNFDADSLWIFLIADSNRIKLKLENLEIISDGDSLQLVSDTTSFIKGKKGEHLNISDNSTSVKFFPAADSIRYRFFDTTIIPNPELDEISLLLGINEETVIDSSLDTLSRSVDTVATEVDSIPDIITLEENGVIPIDLDTNKPMTVPDPNVLVRDSMKENIISSQSMQDSINPTTINSNPILEIQNDSSDVFVEYIVKPGESLFSIASREYSDESKWQQIYKMNIEQIGSDPNIIYPYQKLLLDQGDIPPKSYLTITLVVQPGESLWSIANDVYGDPLAWSILWSDNKNSLGENFNDLKPGTVLKIRSKL